MTDQHIPKQRIKAWLDSGSVDTMLEAHLETCDVCANKAEKLADSGRDVGSALAALLEPSEDLADRMSARVKAAMNDRSDLELLISVLGSGKRTAQILFEPGELPTSDNGGT